MRLRTAILSALAVWAFFFEYLPPAKRVHFFSDIEGYHYPLYTYAQRAFREGRFPQWDAAIYSGISFVGNPQSAVFYPPNWLVYLANSRRAGISFTSIEALLILHLWTGFFLAWLWLRGKARDDTAALLGASVFALGGYAVAEVQHLGMVCGYAWYPLVLWGIDDAVREQRWRPLWKTAVGAALTLLAGYPATWFVLCVTAAVYAAAIAGAAMLLRTGLALAFSLLLAAVQLAPTLAVAAFKSNEQVYGNGIPGGWFFYLQYIFPNYYDQSTKAGRLGLEQETYFYIGAAGLLGIGWLLYRRRFRAMLPAVAIIAVCLFIIRNPYRLIQHALETLPYVGDVCREWNYLAAITLACALLTATGWADLLESRRNALPLRWAARAGIALALAWSARQWLVWRSGGSGFATGWWTLAEAAVTVAILYLLVRAPRRPLVTAVLLLTVWVEFKVYGTSRRFNASPGNPDKQFSADARVGGPDFTGVDPAIYAEMRRNLDYRFTIDGDAFGTDARHYGLTVPNGFDPFLPMQYRKAVEQYRSFDSNRTFFFDWSNPAMLDAFAVRYVLTSPGSKARETLSADSRFRLLEPSASYYQVFEYLAAKPAFRFGSGAAERVLWTPERRRFRVTSTTGGEFHLLEQNLPGWTATIDGQPAAVERAGTAFQAVRVPPGEHWVEFRYIASGLRLGAAVTIAALLAVAAFLRATAASRENTR